MQTIIDTPQSVVNLSWKLFAIGAFGLGAIVFATGSAVYYYRESIHQTEILTVQRRHNVELGRTKRKHERASAKTKVQTLAKINATENRLKECKKVGASANKVIVSIWGHLEDTRASQGNFDFVDFNNKIYNLLWSPFTSGQLSPES